MSQPTPGLHVVAFNRRRRPTRLRVADLPPLVRKVWQLHEQFPLRSVYVEQLVDRLLKP
ncbi:MAG: hypothetical protein IT177_11600 [Acidobacteria bacterium]|nr:hypothetical protein [Acidobacteriota bacterium]